MLLYCRELLTLVGVGSIALGTSFRDQPTLLCPTIHKLLPTSGAAGTTVNIVGNGFDEASLVPFGGIRAHFTRVGPSTIRATVPAGAAAGSISVTTPMGTVTSGSAFLVVL